MCIYISTILPVMLWHVDSAPALKCNGYGLESWLAGHLDKSIIHWREGLVYEYMGWCTLEGSAQGGIVYTGGENLF